MPKEKKAGDKIERTSSEIKAINKAVDEKRKNADKVVDIKMEDEKAEPKKMSKKDRKALLLAYKEQNPVKFASKGFEKELKNL